MPRTETRWIVARDGTICYRGEPAGQLILPLVLKGKRAIWNFTIDERPCCNTRARLRKELQHGRTR